MMVSENARRTPMQAATLALALIAILIVAASTDLVLAQGALFGAPKSAPSAPVPQPPGVLLLIGYMVSARA
jgi:hypothetical protein